MPDHLFEEIDLLNNILQEYFGWGRKNQEPFTWTVFTQVICLFCKGLIFT